MKQPISTAPRDGTVVLLFGGETDEQPYLKTHNVDTRRPVTGFWVEELCEGHYATWESEEPDDWWAMCFWDGKWRTGYINPTHWMEIPK